MNLYTTAKQIVVLLQPAHKSFQFRFPEYSERFTGKSKFGGYITRRFPYFTYRVSKNLTIYLFISKNLEYYTSKIGFYKIYRNIALELNPFLIVRKNDLHFNIKLTNIQAGFPIESQRFIFLKDFNRLNKILNSYFEVNNRPVIIPYDESSSNFYNLVFKQRGSIRLFHRKCSLVANSFENLVFLTDTIRSLVLFAENE